MHGGCRAGEGERREMRWRRIICTSSAVLWMGITRAVAVAHSHTSKRPETEASGAGSTRTRQTGGRCTGAAGTCGSLHEELSAMAAALSSARRMTATPQAARSADAIFAPAGTDAAALELLIGFSRVLAIEEHGSHVDATRDSLGALQEAVLGTIEEIAGVPE
jgi:hypothetical protein